jgi:hypothetical protein
VGVDCYIRPEQEVRGDGVDPWFHLNWAMMDLVEELLDQAGVLDNDTQGPVLPPHADKLDTATYEQVYDAAYNRWEAEQLVRATSLDAIKVPAVKFHTNEGWILTSRECRMLAGALKSVTVEDVRAAFEADEDNIESWEMWGDPPAEVAEALRKAMGDRPSFEEHMTSFTRLSESLRRTLSVPLAISAFACARSSRAGEPAQGDARRARRPSPTPRRHRSGRAPRPGGSIPAIGCPAPARRDEALYVQPPRTAHACGASRAASRATTRLC